MQTANSTHETSSVENNPLELAGTNPSQISKKQQHFQNTSKNACLFRIVVPFANKCIKHSDSSFIRQSPSRFYFLFASRPSLFLHCLIFRIIKLACPESILTKLFKSIFISKNKSSFIYKRNI